MYVKLICFNWIKTVSVEVNELLFSEQTTSQRRATVKPFCQRDEHETGEGERKRKRKTHRNIDFRQVFFIYDPLIK